MVVPSPSIALIGLFLVSVVFVGLLVADWIAKYSRH